MIRVVYVGNYRVPWTTETHVARELEGLGCHVDRIQEPPGGGSETFLQQLRNVAIGAKADLVLWTRTWGLPPDATQLWRRLEAHGIQTASFHLDLYLGLKRESTLATDPFWTTGTVFTPDGDPQSQARFTELGINHIYSPPAVVSDECVPGRQRRTLAHDVVFVGSAASAYHPEFPHRGKLLDHLQATYGDGFRRFGNGTKVMRGSNLNDLMASSKIIVGDSLCLPGHVAYQSDRIFETTGRGGFLLMPEVPGFDGFFTDREHLVYWQFGDFGQLDELIEYYLARPEERKRIQRAGQAHTAEFHTYRHRLAAVLTHLGLAPDPHPI